MSKPDLAPSKTPWRVCGPYSACAEGTEGSILTCSGPNKLANLERIVQRVNIHHDLLAASQANRAYRDHKRECDECEGWDPCITGIYLWDKATALCDAAIVMAKEKPHA